MRIDRGTAQASETATMPATTTEKANGDRPDGTIINAKDGRKNEKEEVEVKGRQIRRTTCLGCGRAC